MLTVLNIAYPLAPVHPATAGGAEQVVGMIDRALVAEGHRSVVIACEGSRIEGTLISTERPSAPWSDAVQRRAQSHYRQVIARAIHGHRPDVVHLHGIDFLHYLPSPGVSAVATLHLPPSWYASGVFSLERPKTWIHCVSSAQRRDCPQTENLLPTIENGVPDICLDHGIRRRNFVVTLGRICPEKGTDTALRVARRAGVPLLIAGEVYPYEAHVRYFEEQVKPLLDRRCARFIGVVETRAKGRLLSAAKCVLVPSNVSETSSLVAMEAAMCGTPVVAFKMGALAEIVEDGRTGYLVKTEAEMAEAVNACSRIDPESCRQAARERFTEQRSQAAYLRMYQGILDQ